MADSNTVMSVQNVDFQYCYVVQIGKREKEWEKRERESMLKTHQFDHDFEKIGL